MAVEHLTKDKFLKDIFDFEKEKAWKYLGKKPAIIDFYADWCGPCKMVAPILKELDKEYGCQIDVFKIDTEAEQELAAMFGIRSIPSLLFIPLTEKPQMAMGALPKQTFKQLIKEVFGIDEKPCKDKPKEQSEA